MSASNAPSDYAIMVGTSGTGIWRSTDGGDHFKWVNWRLNGIACNDLVVRRFVIDPFNPRHVIACTAIFDSGNRLLGSPYGLHESFNSGENWIPIIGFHHIECWRVVFDRTRQGRFYVGTRPAGLYVTDNAGSSFRKLDVVLPSSCRGIGIPRVTSIVIHPDNTDIMFCSLEIGGIWRSLDAGESWERVFHDTDAPLPDCNIYGLEGRLDCHFVDFLPGDPVRVMVSTPDSPYISSDLGKTWTTVDIERPFPHQYHREFIKKLDDPDTIFYGVGDDTAGRAGRLLRSKDSGLSWEVIPLPGSPNATVYSFAQHPANPNRIFACTLKGHLYRTEDGGDSWVKHDWEFAEVRGIGWAPL